MKETVAVIDMGSNTARLKVYALENQEPELLAEGKRKVRLSEDMGDDKQLINPAGIRRAKEAMEYFSEILEAFPKVRVVAIATEAMRRARNGQALAEYLQQQTGIPIRILSGKEEAFYVYAAVRHSLPYKDALLLDAGGGSCELILMQKGQCRQLVSLPLGSIILSEKYTNRGEMSAAALFRLFNHVHARLAAISWLKEGQNLPLIAIGGNQRAVAKLWRNNQDDDRPLHGYEMTKDNLNGIYMDLLDADSSRRQAMLGKNKDRSDIITAGLAPLIQTVRLIDPSKIVFCETGLREGILYSEKQDQAPSDILT